MRIWAVLISRDWYYLWENWQLPKRPDGDKEFLLNLVKDKIVLCSVNTMIDLPSSIKDRCKHITNNPMMPWDINFWIDTFKQVCDLFIVIKSDSDLDWWKKFNIDRIESMYNKLMDINWITLYLKK